MSDPQTTPTQRMKQQMIDAAGPKDWPEDYMDENGTYQCKCVECLQTFMGYKRRILCKECAHVG